MHGRNTGSYICVCALDFATEQVGNKSLNGITQSLLIRLLDSHIKQTSKHAHIRTSLPPSSTPPSCYRKEGVNHYQNCRAYVDAYVSAISDSDLLNPKQRQGRIEKWGGGLNLHNTNLTIHTTSRREGGGLKGIGA